MESTVISRIFQEYCYSSTPMSVEVSNRAVDGNSRARLTCYPRGNFYPLSRAFLQRALGSLSPTFVSARDVPLAVKPAYAFTRPLRFPSGASRPYGLLRYPLGGFLPRKTAHQPLSLNVYAVEVRNLNLKGGCFIDGSIRPESRTSLPPRYATHPSSNFNSRLQ